MYLSCSFCLMECKDSENLVDLQMNSKNKKIYLTNYLSIFKPELIEFAVNDLSKKICSKCFKLLESTYNLLHRAKDIWNQNYKEKTKMKIYRPILPKLDPIDSELPESHINSHIEEKFSRVYKCTDCPLNFKSYKQLKIHEETHFILRENGSLCKFCCSLFMNEQYLLQHIENCHEDDKFTCIPCKKKFKCRGHLLKHVNNVHKSREMLYYCAICPENTKFVTFISRNTIHQHYIDFHKVTSSTKSLDINDDDIDMNVEFLDEYLLNIADENSFQFSECWDSLDLHLADVFHTQNVNNVYNQNENTPYLCPKCTEGCSNIKSLFMHLAEKHKFLCLNCTTCTIHIPNKNLLLIHNVSPCDNKEHVKKFMCPYCPKAFRFDSYLRQHLRNIHSYIKKHTCQLCDLRFSTVDHLKKHVLSRHQNDRKHICHICAKRFTQLCHLKQHLSTHKYNNSK